MTDNSTLPATGDVIAADDIDGVKYQRFKPAFGADGSATDVSASAGLPVASGALSLAGSGSSLNADLIPSTDVSAYRSATLQFTGTWEGTVRFQESNDEITWFSANCYYDAQANNPARGSATSITGKIYMGNVRCKYFRVRYTAYTSGTATCIALFSAVPITPSSIVVESQGTVFSVSGPVTQALTTEATLSSSSAKTTTLATSDQTNNGGCGVRVVLDVTVAGTGSVTLEIQAKDSASGKYVAMLTGAAVTTISTNVYIVHPLLAAVANSVANNVIPKIWRVVVTANNANSMTYSVGSCVLL